MKKSKKARNKKQPGVIKDHGWKPSGWWRTIAPDGTLWCEGSDEKEVRELARPGDRIQRHMRRLQEGWVDA